MIVYLYTCRYISVLISIKKSENRAMNTYFVPAGLILAIVQIIVL